MTTVLLGNTAPLMADGTPAGIGNTITTVSMRDGWDDADVAALALSTGNDMVLNTIGKVIGEDRFAIGVLEVNSLWTGAHSADPPEWVESDDEGFARELGAWFSGNGHECHVGRPAEWRSFDELPPIGGGALGWEHFEDAFSPEFRAAWREHELLTTVGRDALHRQHSDTAAQPAAFNYMAVSANVTAVSAASTTLPGEIVSGTTGGLGRAQATFAHTNGTNTSTLTLTFTASGTGLPVTVAKIGILNAVSVGTLGYETMLNATATLTTAGDNVAITWTWTGA